jgi:hypothetical protein
MAVIGISRSETFEYVLDSDPCKKRVELEVPRIEDAAADNRRRRSPRPEHATSCASPPHVRTPPPLIARQRSPTALSATMPCFYSPGGTGQRGMA